MARLRSYAHADTHADANTHTHRHSYCRACAKPGAYTFQLRGPGWTPRFGIYHGDLPPHDEVIARKREQGIKTLRTSEVDS